MKVSHYELTLPFEVQEIWEVLENKGFETWLVGGAVRDIICNKEPNDFDLATQATPEEIAHVVECNMPDAKISFVGANFGVTLVNGIEIATLREDLYDETGTVHLGVKYTRDLVKDLGRRDFTVNAMALDSFGCITDPYGGLKDMELRRLNFVGDPEKRILQDEDGYIRILRYFRFIAKLGFATTEEAAEAIYTNRHVVKSIAPEKIRLELLKVMKLDQPSIFFGSLRFMQILDLIWPEMSDCYNHTHGKHHPEDVLEHLYNVGDALPKDDPILRLAGYLHDIGKPESYKRLIGTPDEGKFLNHHVIGMDIAEDMLRRLKFSNKEIERIKGLVRCHMYYIEGISPKAQRKLMRNLESFGVGWRDLVRLRVADHNGNDGKDNMTLSQIKELVASFLYIKPPPRSTHDLNVSGGQLIEEFLLERGPEVSKLLKALLDFSDESGVEDEDCLLVQANKILGE